jgi:hypothetical protein
MRAIWDAYTKYEKGEEVPSPEKLIEAAALPAGPYRDRDAWSEPYVEPTLIPVQSQYEPRKWGLRDEFDRIVVPFRFDGAPRFEGQFALVSVDSRYAIINRKGEFLFGPQEKRVDKDANGYALDAGYESKRTEWAYGCAGVEVRASERLVLRGGRFEPSGERVATLSEASRGLYLVVGGGGETSEDVKESARANAAAQCRQFESEFTATYQARGFRVVRNR